MDRNLRFALLAAAVALVLSCVDTEGPKNECSTDEDCGDGAVCSHFVSGCGPSGSECMALPREGEGCDFWQHCAEGLICHEAAGRVCAEASGLGEACASSADCGTDRHNPAPDALVCDLDAGTCAAPLGLQAGARCDDRRACEPGLSCVGVDDEFRCAAPGETGAPCTIVGGGGTDRACADGLLCGLVDGERTCVAPAGAGEDCPRLDGCAPGLVCRLADEVKVCGDRYGAGERCHSLLCDEGLACTAQSDGEKRCEPAAGEGEACDEQTVCADPLRCDGGVCVPWRLGGEGEACGLLLPCAPGLICGEGTCTTGAAAGASCGGLAPCGYGLECVGGVCVP